VSEGGEVLTGWVPKFLVRRASSPEERASSLTIKVSNSVVPDEVSSVVRFNSTFIETVDRTFKIKGMVTTASFIAYHIVALVALSFVAKKLWGLNGPLGEKILAFSVLLVVAGAGALYFWRLVLAKDLFQYTYYPVRFNRITRKIHFFRHNGPDGVVTVPWGSPYAFFHIGRGTQDPELRDLRCHLLDSNGLIQQTFTVGHFWSHDHEVHELWALICRYMQDGPEHCFDDPLDRVITLSPKGTLRNCWMMVCLMMGTTLFPLRYTLMFPVYAGLTASRWLTFLTCRTPKFPPEIEAECAIAADDSYRLPEPRFMAEFASDPAIYRRALKKHRERELWR
jgi:hypothetical protein